MLVFKRCAGQAFMIGDDTKVKILAVDHRQVSVGIEAPINVSVHRLEVYNQIHGLTQADNLYPDEKDIKQELFGYSLEFMLPDDTTVRLSHINKNTLVEAARVLYAEKVREVSQRGR